MTDARIYAGKIGKPFGIKGAVYVHPDSDLGDILVPGVTCQTTDGQELTVSHAQWNNARYVVTFRTFSTREAAETLRGQVLTVPKSLVALDEDAMWVDDMIGTPIVAPDGTPLGSVAGVIDGFAHDYVVVATLQGHHALVPFVSQMLTTDATPFVLDAPEGLLDVPFEHDHPASQDGD